MDSQNQREVVRQLADDLGWLEVQCRHEDDAGQQSAQLRLAAALTRNVIGPALEGRADAPIHVAVVGGAGAGKSTVVNFLAGRVVAEANPQAGYTRHPTAFLTAKWLPSWPANLGFLGSLQRLDTPQPANLDQDVYQQRLIETPPGPDALAEIVIWDCPDMTTRSSNGYVPRLLEVIALADIVVYITSDERYNDEIPTHYLHQIVRAGKAVICCITKVHESNAVALSEHFRIEVLGRLPQTPSGQDNTLPIVTLPQMSLAERQDPAGLGAKYRVPLLNQLLVMYPTAAVTRKRTIICAMDYLQLAGDGLLDVARRDLAVLDVWRSLVTNGQEVFEDRYRQEFLAGEPFRRFDRTQEQVLHMLELSGPGQVLSQILRFIRLPVTYLRDFLISSLSRPPGPSLSEQAVCTTALSAWLDGLQAETLRRTDSHPTWKQLAHRFETGLKLEVRDRFAQVFRTFEMKETDELDEAAKAIPERLANSPGLLASLRLGMLALDLAVPIGILTLIWPPQWYHLLLLPVTLGITRQIVEWIVMGLVDRGRNRLRDHRLALVHEHLSGPIAGGLTDAPVVGGSIAERLQQVLQRVPWAIRELAGSIQTRYSSSPTAP